MSGDFAINPFQKAVVVALYNGPDSFGEISSYLSEAGIKAPIEKIPRNSLFVRRISRGADASGSSLTLCYPFFSSHLQLPVKPTEVVWVIFDKDDMTTGYWIGRIHGDETGEDANFSHFDRQFIALNEKKDLADKISIAPTQEENEDFPNFSLLKKEDEENPYDSILLRSSTSLIKTSLEPVPRFQKRPGDFVIQGSNNCLISLGTDRGWSVFDNPEDEGFSNSSDEIKSFSGAIDIVAGRSRWISVGESNKRTNPSIRTNRRNFSEVSKRQEDYENLNVSEGDPDFRDDASRVYVTQNSDFDYKFGLKEIIPTNFLNSVEIDKSGAAIVAKSDNIRLIARKDVEHNIAGSIVITKEGTKSDDLATIRITPEGIIQISGKEIHIGRSFADGGEGGGPGPGGSQPYVKYKQLEDLLISIISDVKDFCDTMSKHVTPGFGAPSPQINIAVQKLKASLQIRETEIPKIKSKRIFGE